MKKTQFNSVALRTFCLFLCAALLVFTIVRPVQVNAAVPGIILYIVGSVVASLIMSDCLGNIAKLSPDAIKEITNMVNENKERFIDLMVDNYNADRSKMTFSEAFIYELCAIIRDSPALLSILGLEADWMEAKLSKIQVGTQVYVPTEEMLARPELITQDVLLTGELSNIKLILYDLQTALSGLSLSIGEMRRELITWTGNVNDTVAEFGRDTEIWLGNVNSSVSSWGRSTVDWVKNVNANLVHYSGVLGQKIDNIALKFDALVEVFPEVSQRLDSIVEKIPAYVEPQVVPKPNVQVEIGTQVLAVTDYQSLGKAFEMKLSWIPQIFNFLRELFERITYTGEPPKVILNLKSSDPDSPWNRDVCILDMSWYEPYKQYGDTIISGFLWLGFGWILYKRTPDVLAGMGLSENLPSDVGSGYAQIGKYEDTTSKKRGKKR